MAFGLKNAPSTFQQLMTQEVLSGYIQDFVMVYLDDIIIYSNSYEEHIHHLRLVLERLQLHGLHCSLNKCTFATNSLLYLGHEIRGEINTPQIKHLDQLQNYAIPRNKKDIQSFLGVLNWLREYIPRLSEITAPLTELLSPKCKWKWGSEQQEAFEKIKNEASKPLILHRPDPSLPFVLQCDSSTIGIAATLYQEGPNNIKYIISYSSARLNRAERKYHINELECLAITWGVKRYRAYLEDRPFKLVTDSRSLLWLNKNMDTKAKLTRWSLLLQEFTFTLVHCPGKLNQLPDFLSRNPSNEFVENVDDIERLLPPEINQESDDPSQPITSAVDTVIEVINHIVPFNEPPLYLLVEKAQSEDESIWRDKIKWKRLRDEGCKTRSENKFFEYFSIVNEKLIVINSKELEYYIHFTTQFTPDTLEGMKPLNR